MPSSVVRWGIGVPISDRAAHPNSMAARAGRGGQMQSDRQARISERAHQIWLAEGRVHGRHDEHWQRAEREIAEEELRAAAALAGRAAGAAKTTRRRPAAT